VQKLLPDNEKYRKRWVAYFDLLGFTKLIEGEDWRRVHNAYSKAIERAKRDLGADPEVKRIWFSDTFIFYSENGTIGDFGSIDLFARYFIYFILNDKIPLRGSLSFGHFYADETNDMYFGPALIEAYQFGEDQDWIGFILCPSSVKHLKDIGLPAKERLNYRFHNIPWKNATPSSRAELPAYLIGEHRKLNNRNPCLESLKQMRNRSGEARVVGKYDRTISFIEKYQMPVVVRKKAKPAGH
jgi:hypothetical protein